MNTTLTLADLGWSAHFQSQTDDAERARAVRLTSVARDRLFAIGPEGPETVLAPSDESTGDFATGDWVILNDSRARVARRLKPTSQLTRRAAGTGATVQPIAANVDTLGIVTSCNDDFNEARLERYLALAATAGSLPLVILTKADLCDDANAYRKRAERLSPLVTAIALDATNPTEAEMLAPWCRGGQTIALVGSSGVGKSTLANGLTEAHAATQGIREDDAKGRHTTTARGMFHTRFGGWLIDTPGMRALRLTDSSEGISTVFDDIESLAQTCRFSDCQHETEPGCAVQAAIESGALSADRLGRWRKLLREDAHNSATLYEARSRDKAFGKMVRSVMKDKKDRRG